jgi:hypothetical protein
MAAKRPEGVGAAARDMKIEGRQRAASGNPTQPSLYFGWTGQAVARVEPKYWRGDPPLNGEGKGSALHPKLFQS